MDDVNGEVLSWLVQVKARSVARFGRIDRSDRLSPFIDSHNALCPGAQA
jgi:hypothetical protein